MGNVAETKQDEQQVQTESVQPEPVQAAPAQAALELLEQQAMAKNQKQKKGNGPLLPILTVLLVLVGLCEAALWGYFAFASFQANRALRQYEAEQSGQEQAARAAGASAYGPRMKVENGQITWRLEDDIDPTAGGTAAPAQNGGGQAASSAGRIAFPKIPYALAEPETAGLPSVADGGSQTLT